jgi:hypothetical protein
VCCFTPLSAFTGGQKADNRESGGGHPGGLCPQARQGAMPSVAEAPPEGSLAVVPSRFFLRPSPSLFDGILELRETLKNYEKRGL